MRRCRRATLSHLPHICRRFQICRCSAKRPRSGYPAIASVCRPTCLDRRRLGRYSGNDIIRCATTLKAKRRGRRQRAMTQLRIESIECVALSMPLPRTFRGSNYFMTHRCTIITRVCTAEGIVGECYNGDEFETQAEVVRSSPTKSRLCYQRQGRLQYRRLLGAHAQAEQQHPARPQARDVRAGLRRQCDLGRRRQGARHAAL